MDSLRAQIAPVFASATQLPLPVILPNGSTGGHRLPHILEAQQHGQHAFKLAVQMNLVAPEPLQLVGVKRLPECLIADQLPVRQLGFSRFEPWQYLRLQEVSQTFDIGRGGSIAFV